MIHSLRGFMILQPALGPEHVGIIAEDVLIMMGYPRINTNN
jgi:hypothetical protein